MSQATHLRHSSVLRLIVEHQRARLLVHSFWFAEVKEYPFALGTEPGSEEGLPAIGFIYPKEEGKSSADPTPQVQRVQRVLQPRLHLSLSPNSRKIVILSPLLPMRQTPITVGKARLS